MEAIESIPKLRLLALRVLIVILLVGQACSYVLLRQYIQRVGDISFDGNTLLLVGEIQKLVFSLAMLYFSSEETIHKSFYEFAWSGAVMLVPAVSYSLVSLLSFVSLQNINSSLYVTINQLKVFSTAIASILILGTSLSFSRWVSLFLLVIGGIIVTEQEVGQSNSESSKDDSVSFSLGLFCVLLQVAISGLVSAYYEKILKFSKGSIWERNIQLALISMILYSMNILFTSNVDFISELLRWNWVILLTATLGAAGGILVALCTKYLDSVAKCVVLSFSVLLTVYLSHFFFDSSLSSGTVVGAFFVVSGSLLYNQPELLDQLLHYFSLDKGIKIPEIYQDK